MSKLTGGRAAKLGDEARGRGDWITAAEQYRLHLKKKPRDFAIWVQLGHALKEQGKRAEALVAYNVALKLDPIDADLLLSLGHLNKLMGNHDVAVSFYKRSADIHPNSQAVSELQALGQVRGRPAKLFPVNCLNYGGVVGINPNTYTGAQIYALALRFNSDWYAARNRDLGEYAADPFNHFVNVGLNEGRSPNPYEEPRDAWRPVLDTEWYLERNPDVRDAQLDPIEHYIFHGIEERRRPNRDYQLDSRPVTTAVLQVLKKGSFDDNVALFVTHTENGAIKPHVEPYLLALRQAGIGTILIIASEKAVHDVPDTIKMLVNIIYVRENQGFDFAAWAHILRIMPELYQTKNLYFLNDSVLGPVNQRTFEDVLDRIHTNEAELVGLTANWERGWHIQSYFLAVKAPILRSMHFQAFMNGIVSYHNKEDVVNEYETQLSRYLQDGGFRCVALFISPDRRNPTVFHWRELLEQGIPFIKIGILWRRIDGVDAAGWRDLLSIQGYDVSLADRTLAQLIGIPRKP